MRLVEKKEYPNVYEKNVGKKTVQDWRRDIEISNGKMVLRVSMKFSRLCRNEMA